MQKNIYPFLLLCICCSAGFLQAARAGNSGYYQDTPVTKTYTGKLVNKSGVPLLNATVIVMTTEVTAKTDKDGRFTIQAIPGDSLLITSPEYVTRRYLLGNEMDFSIILVKDETIVLKKPKQVEMIYYKVPASQSLASTDAVYNETIIKMPVTSIRNVLTGRLAGIYTSQNSGQPGSDGVGINMRGSSPLIIIDGIVRNLTVLDLEEIESITVVKDALGSAMLGVRSGAGALLITTRKGAPGKQNISLTVQSASQQSIKMTRPVGAYDYARLYNEALANDGLPAAYTAADLQAYKDGSDPYGHPDVNWIDKVLRSSSRFNRYTLSFSGGSDMARYFVAAEHLSQAGFFITSKENKYNTNNDFKSYIIRSNIDVNLTKQTSIGLHLLGRILNGTEPGFGTGGIITTLLNTPNNAYPVFNPNGSLGGAQLLQSNIYGQVLKSGYRQNYKRDAFVDLYVKRTLDELLDGLWIKGILSFNSTLSQTSLRVKSFASYKMSISGTDTTYQKFGNDGTQSNSTGMDYQGRQSYVEFSLGYEKRKGQHGISALVMANQDNVADNSNLPLRYRGISGRMAYDLNNKYQAEVTFGYNGSNRYPEGTRIRFFPAAGLGWNLHEESFMKEVSWLNTLKLSGTYGKTGWDNAGYFVYNQYYFDGVGYTLGTSATGNISMNQLVLANPGIDYEKALKLNLSVDAAAFNNRLSLKATWYSTKYYDVLMQRGRNTALIGNDYPNENIGQYRYNGTELNIGWQENAKPFQYFINLNAAVMKSKVLYIDEVFRPYDWMKRTGRSSETLYGYTAVGLFQTQDEINNSATIDGYTPQRGDIKYQDMNNDGVINQFDQGPIANTKPLVFGGLELGFSWKGFDFSALLQGVKNRTIALTGLSEWEFQAGGIAQAYEHHLNRWTPENVNATYPRLTVGTNTNNHQFSSYWTHSGDYARLKFVELGYSLPRDLIGRIRLEKIRLFVSATNLFTISAYDRVDPEVFWGSYPIQRVINTGINIKF